MQQVSVVIPLFNKAPFIERTIRSVLSQTASDFEIVVVDDGSTDGGGKIVESIGDPRIRLTWQENQGESAARNRGITEAGHDLIAFLDADDFWQPRFLEEIHSLRQQFPQAGAYATAYDTLTLQGIVSPVFNILPPGQKTGLVNYVKVCKYEPIRIASIAIPKRVLAEIGGFPVGEFILGDFDTLLRMGLRYPVAWSSERLATFYQVDWHEKNSQRFRQITREPKVVRTAREAIAQGLVAPDDLPYLKEVISLILLGQARFLLQYGDEILGRAFIESALEIHASPEGRCMRLAAALPGNLYYGEITPFLRNLKNQMVKVDLIKKIYNKIRNHRYNIFILLSILNYIEFLTK